MIEENKTSEKDFDVIYVKDRPFRVLFKHVLIASVSGVFVLFTVGFIIGLLGLRVPYIDSDVISNQWGSLTGGTQGTSEWNELEKNP